ncbi:MAG: hypothetical protein AB1762_07655, partial [Gemmatimonadota bacterium]
MNDAEPRAVAPRLRIVPRPRLAYVIAALALLWLIPGATAAAAVIGAGMLLLVAIAVDLFTLPARRSLAVVREFPSRAGLGDPLDAAYHVASRWRWPARVTLRDELPPALHGGGTQTFTLAPATT